MSNATGNSAPNSPNADSTGGGRVRQYEERTKEKAPPEAVGTFRRSFQSGFISMFTGKPCVLKQEEPKTVAAAPEETVATSLQTHPKVQMHPLLQRNAMSPSNNSKNSLLNMLSKQHNEAVQRAMEAEGQQAESENAESVQKSNGIGVAPASPSVGEKLSLKTSVQKSDTEDQPSLSKSENAPAEQPEVQTNISPSGEADKDVQTQPQGPHRTRADPAGPVRVQSSSSEFGAVQMDGKENISQKSDTEDALGNAVSLKNKYVQAAGQTQSGTPELESELKSSKGAGTPMSDTDRGFFESRMGADFSNVRIHTGSNAVQMNEGLGAKAFAHGSDIYFNSNQYQPGTSAGKHLLAHELTHTVQQGGSSVRKSESEEAESGSVQKSDDETAAPKIQAKCDSCAAEDGSVQKTEEESVQQSEDETAAPKIQTQCTSCGANDSLPQISRTSHSNSALDLQPSLKIGQPGDKYEQEADATADKVMRMSDEQVAPSRIHSPTVSRQAEEAEGEQVSTKVEFPTIPDATQKEKPVIEGESKQEDAPQPDAAAEGKEEEKPAGGEGGAGGEPGIIDVPPPPAKKSKPTPAPEIRMKEEEAQPQVVPAQIQESAQLQIQRLETKTNDAKTERPGKRPNDGEAVKGKSNSRIESDPDFDEDAPRNASQMDEEARKKSKPDPSKKRAKNSDVKAEGVTEPPVNRGAEAMSKTSDAKSQTESKLNEQGGEAKGKEPGEKGGKAELSPAETAAAKSAELLAEMAALQPPGPPKPFDHPVIETPVDSDSKQIPPDLKTDSHVRGMGEINATLRDTAYQMQLFAFEEQRIALGNEAAIWKSREELENAKTGTKNHEDHNKERKDIAAKAHKASTETQARASFVTEHSEKLSAEANKSQGDTGKMSSEASSTAAQNESEPAGDSDAEADKAKSQGDMNDAKDGSAKMDGAVSGVGQRAVQYGGEAAAAAQTNKQTDAKIVANDDAIAKIDARVAQLHAENAKSQGQITKAEKGPGDVKKEAQKTAKSGDELLAATVQAEEDLKAIQTAYLGEFKQLEKREDAQKREDEERQKKEAANNPTKEELQLVKMSAMSEEDMEQYMDTMSDEEVAGLEGTLEGLETAATETEADQNKSKFLETDPASGQVKLKGFNEAIFGKEKGDPRADQIEAIHQKRRDRLKVVKENTDKNFGFLTREQKQMLALKLLGKRLTDEVKNISVIQMAGEMVKGMINPVTAIKGAIGGFEKLGSGVLNLFNPDAWAKDPLGNLLKSATDIAMGLATILNSIVGLAVAITALMVAITIVTWGFALPVTGPVMGWMGTVISTVGGWAFIVSAVALVLNYLSFIKNLHDAGAAQSSEELLGETDAMYENTTGALESAMGLVGGKAGAKMGPKLGGPKWLPTKGAGGKWVKGKEFMTTLGGNLKTGAKNIGTGISTAARGLLAKGKGGLKKLSDRIKKFFSKRKEKKGGGSEKGGANSNSKGGGQKESTKKSHSELNDGAVAVHDGPNGHKYKVQPDGMVAICSTCTTLRMKYGAELSKNPSLKSRLDLIEAKLKIHPQNKRLMRQFNSLHKELSQIRRLSEQFNKLINSTNRKSFLRSSQHKKARQKAWDTHKKNNPGANKGKFFNDYDRMQWNFLKGRIMEREFQKIMGGLTSRVTNRFTGTFKNGAQWIRYVDNLKGKLIREIKSGRLHGSGFTWQQVRKDLEMAKKLGFKPEWHIFGGVATDVRSQQILNFMKKSGFKIILY